MSKKRIMVQMPVTPGIRSVLDERDDVEYERFTELSEENILQHIANYDGAILGGVAPFTARIVGNASRLAVVSRHGVGYDNVDVAALTAAGIPLTVTGTANSVTVAEHSLFFMMSLAKHAVKFDREVRKGNWDIRFENTAIDLAGRRVLILGFGRIGQILVKRCLGMDMDVWVHDPYAPDEAIRAAGAAPATDWKALLPELDFLSVNCPKTDETTGMVGKAELAAMKPSAYVVNTARGGIVEEAALVDALERRIIAGAAVDAFEVEPATADNPLFALDNILVSPHSAGVTEESMFRMGAACAQNVVDCFDGKLDPANVVNREVLG
ncbi:MAG: hydroxyacid dehydrogenase [Immundisolibacterales bacterium]|nr:hydroxyacid dehydrogenase [Immundisolibacterales bacterium]